MRLKLGILSVLCLISIFSNIIYAEVITDAELEQLESQIEKQEIQEKIEAEQKLKLEQENQRRAKKRAEEVRQKELENERQAEILRQKKEEEQRIADEEKRRLEAARKKEELKRLAIEEQKRKEEEAEKSKVTLVFYRDQDFPFTGDSALISHNGSQIGSLHSKAFFIYTCPPGKQTFSTVIFQNWTTKKEFDFLPGQTYFVMTAIDWDSVHLSLESNEPKAIKKLKNTGSIGAEGVF